MREPSVLMTIVACLRIDADALAFVDDRSALTMCCATTAACSGSSTRADAVEMSYRRCVDLINPQ